MWYKAKIKDLSSVPSKGFWGSGSLFRVLQPFNPFTFAPVTEAYKLRGKKGKLSILL